MAASRLVAKDNIRREIRAAMRARSCRTGLRADRVVRELARIAFSDPVYLVDIQGQPRPLREIPLDTRRALASVKVKRERVTRRVVKKGKRRTTVTTRETIVEFKFWDKLVALGRLFEHLGLATTIPPLEVLLAALPAGMAVELRELLARDQ